MSALKESLQAALADFPGHSQPAPDLQPLARRLNPAIQGLIAPLQSELTQAFKHLEETIKQGAGQLRAESEEIEGKVEQLVRGLRDETERQRTGVEQLKSLLEVEMTGEELGKLERLEKDTELRAEEIREYAEKVIKAKVSLTDVKYENDQLTFILTNRKLYPLTDLRLNLSSATSVLQSFPISDPLPASSSLSLSFPLSLPSNHLYFVQILWQNRPLSPQELVAFC